MSVQHSIIPIDEEHYQQLNEYLARFGVEIPIGTTSRYPTPSEIRRVLDEMPQYTKSYSITETVWDVSIFETAGYDQEHRLISGKHTSIYSIGFAANDSVPLHIYFHSGWEELNLEIVLRLTFFTGPLLLICDSDTVPLLVSLGEELSGLIKQWEKNREIASFS